MGLCLVLAGGIPAALAQAPENQGRLAFVDLQRLIEEAPQMRDWRERLQREFAARNRELALEATSIEALKGRRDTESALLSTDQLAQLTRQIETGERALRRARSELASLESLRKNEALDAISKRIGEAAASAAKARGFNGVLTRENAVFIDPALDLTAPVLEQLRKDAEPQ
jgi:outer membrane protein